MQTTARTAVWQVRRCRCDGGQCRVAASGGLEQPLLAQFGACRSQHQCKAPGTLLEEAPPLSCGRREFKLLKPDASALTAASRPVHRVHSARTLPPAARSLRCVHQP